MKRQIKFIESSFVDISDDLLSNINVVIHLAAITNASESFNNSQIEEVNIKQTKEFIDRCVKIPQCKFFFPSSTSVYGVASNLVVEDNDDFLNPQSPYAESKIEIERYLQAADIQFIIGRLGTIFGCSPGMRFHTAINKFCYQASLGLPLTIWKENYEQYRPYLDLQDGIEAILFLIKNSKPYQTYNIVTDNYKLSQVVEFISDTHTVALDKVDTPLLNQYSYKVSNKKLKHLGYNPTGDLRQGIESTMEMLKCVRSY